jgi:hypothetical protein
MVRVLGAVPGTKQRPVPPAGISQSLEAQRCHKEWWPTKSCLAAAWSDVVTYTKNGGRRKLSQLKCIFHGTQLGTTSPPDCCDRSRARELAPFGPAGSACAAARTPAVRRSIPP